MLTSHETLAYTNFHTLRTDPLPDRTYDNNRPPEDPPLLRAETKGQRHRSLLPGPAPHPYPLAFDRILRGALRHHGPLWRLPRHHRSVRPQRARRRPIYRRLDRSHWFRREEKRRTTRMSGGNATKKDMLHIGRCWDQSIGVHSALLTRGSIPDPSYFSA